MMTFEELKKEADRLARIPGNTKGSEIHSLARYLKDKYGEEGVLKVEKKMEELGYPFHFKDFKLSDWYSEGLNVLSMLVAKEIFGWKDLYDFGYASLVYSFGLRIFLKFASLKSIFDNAGRSWSRFTDFGKIESYEFNEKEKYVILRLKGYKTHPLTCSYFSGVFLHVLEFSLVKKASIEETKCVWKGDDCDEFVVRWR